MSQILLQQFPVCFQPDHMTINYNDAAGKWQPSLPSYRARDLGWTLSLACLYNEFIIDYLIYLVLLNERHFLKKLKDTRSK